jgi:D-amino-acid dehydrogenase
MAPWFLRFVQAGRAGELQRITGALSALLGRVYTDLVPLLDETGLAACLRRAGALTVYESRAAYLQDRVEWDLKREHGIECHEMSGDEARTLEPALAPCITSAVFTPAWSNVTDPKRIWSGLLNAVRARDVSIDQRDVRGIGGGGEVQLTVSHTDVAASPEARWCGLPDRG